MRSKIITLAFILLTTISHAQSSRETLEKLASPGFHGRGYYKNGDRKAAKYIESRFRSIGLQPVNGAYTQPFRFQVNTFPGRMKVKVGEKKLVPGKDYIVSPACPTVKGTFRLERVTVPLPDFSARDYSDDFILIDKTGADSTGRAILDSLMKFPPNVKGVLFADSAKLTWSVSTKVNDRIFVRALRDSFPGNATTISLDVENKLIPDYESVNVMGWLPGTTQPDSFIVFTAHFDHLGRMGKKALFAGANDNASGTAMIIDLAEYFSKPANRPKKSVLFIAFAAEEAGLIGSKYYTDNPPLPLERISFLLNLDLMGNGQDGVMVVNGEVHKEAFAVMDSINKADKLVREVGMRGKARNSDHYWFSERGVPAFFLYTMGGSKAYHDIYDIPANLSLEEFEDVKRLLVEFVRQLDSPY
jgi:hypothetical protein